MSGHAALCCAVVAAFVLGAHCMDEEMAELAKMLHDNCGEETGADLSLVDKVNAGADLMPDAKLKCYIKCIMETAGMLSDGEVDVEAVIALLPEDMAKKNGDNLRACGTQKGADDCDTAFLTQTAAICAIEAKSSRSRSALDPPCGECGCSRAAAAANWNNDSGIVQFIRVNRD